MYIAFKEANETDYWLELLFESDYIGQQEYKKIKTVTFYCSSNYINTFQEIESIIY